MLGYVAGQFDAPNSYPRCWSVSLGTIYTSYPTQRDKSIAYSSQEAWIQNATIQQNIKFQTTKYSTHKYG